MDATPPPIHIIGLAGSLRGGSYNRALLHAAGEEAPDRAEVRAHDWTDLPLYDADRDTDDERPASVTAFKEAIAEADALLVASPEYNHGVPGVLKNAIDWASRPGGHSVLKGKPVGLMGASAGAMGAVRAQEHLKQIFDATLSHVMPHPGVLVARAGEKFSGDGRLTDEATRDFVADFMIQFARWTRRLSDARPPA